MWFVLKKLLTVAEGGWWRDVRRAVFEPADQPDGRRLGLQGRLPVAGWGPYDIRGDWPQPAPSAPQPLTRVPCHSPRDSHREDSTHGQSAGKLRIAFRFRLSVQWISSFVILYYPSFEANHILFSFWKYFPLFIF